MEKSERFESLVERSKRLADAIQKKNSDLTPLLADQYNDPSHFVYEIIQNAEDAGAEEVSFELSSDRLTIFHDGRDFNFEDIEDITGFGNSRKKGELNKIGEFGVGFKSVFAVTKAPRVYSGGYSIKIEDFVVPVDLGGEAPSRGTKIELPFNHDQRSKSGTFSLVQSRLKNIGAESLLFLQSINEIGWKTPNGSGRYHKSEEKVEGIEGARRALVTSGSPGEERLDEYLIFRKPGPKPNTRREEVAYKIGEDREEKRAIRPVKKSELVVFFPTKKDTYLDFLLQGPYKTTPNRENIPLGNDKNKKIVEETADLVSESLLKIKDLGLFDVEFLEVLPTDEANESKSEIYASVHRSVKKSLRHEELLPTSTGGHVSANDALLAESEALTELLGSEDTDILFSKSSWLDTRITSNRTPALWDYLRNQLGVEAVSFGSFARRITADFLERKSDQWMLEFYAQLRNQRRLWRKRGSPVLRTKPIIRTAGGEHLAPFEEDGTPQVYLPTKKTSEYPTVKPSLIEDDRARAFLEDDLGLEPPDLFSELHEHILPRYEETSQEGAPCEGTPHEEARPKGGISGRAESDYLDDLKRMVRACQDSDSAQKKRRLTRKLRDLPFLRSVNPAAGEQALRKPTEVYVGTSELREYFSGYEGAWFVSEELFEDFEDEKFASFLDKVGVARCPRRVGFDPELSHRKRRELRGEDYTEEHGQTDYDLEGLGHFLKRGMSRERSLLLWRLLAERAEIESGRYFFKGEYSWKYYEDKSVRFDAKFYKTLAEKQWIFDREDNQKRPRQLAPFQMASGYQLESEGAELLKEQLPFKSELEDQLPEERKQILEVADRYGVSHGELEKLLEREKEKQAPSKDNGSSEDPSRGESSHEDPSHEDPSRGESSRRESLHRESLHRESSQEEWEPEASPTEATPTVLRVGSQEVSRPDLGDQNPEGRSSPTASRGPEDAAYRKAVGKKAVDGKDRRTSGAGKASGASREQPVSSSSNREIGQWGERHVLEMLRKEHEGKETEVIWLNEGNDRGEGRDIVLKEDNGDKTHIEVKSKTRMNPEWVRVTHTQWELARRLHDQEKDEDYWFYIVLGAGSKNPEIRMLKNPIEQWKRGKRLAHPINLKLT